MWLKPGVTEQAAERAPGEYGASIYLEAYHYALDLCDNPAIAREVASRFVKCMQVEEPAAIAPQLSKA
jgi:hypothetical protein